MLYSIVTRDVLQPTDLYGHDLNAFASLIKEEERNYITFTVEEVITQ